MSLNLFLSPVLIGAQMNVHEYASNPPAQPSLKEPIRDKTNSVFTTSDGPYSALIEAIRLLLSNIFIRPAIS